MQMPGEPVNSLRMMSQSAVPSQFPMTAQQHFPTSTAPVLPESGAMTRPGVTSTSVPASLSTNTQTSSIRLSPLLGVAPLGPRKLTEEHHHQADMLMAAYSHIPHPSDSERLRFVQHISASDGK